MFAGLHQRGLVFQGFLALQFHEFAACFLSNLFYARNRIDKCYIGYVDLERRTTGRKIAKSRRVFSWPSLEKTVSSIFPGGVKKTWLTVASLHYKIYQGRPIYRKSGRTRGISGLYSVDCVVLEYGYCYAVLRRQKYPGLFELKID